MRSTTFANHRFRGPGARGPPHNGALRIIPANRLAPELALGAVVVDGQSSVLQEPLERNPLIACVAERRGGVGVSSSARAASSSHQAKNESTIGFESAKRALSRSWGGAAVPLALDGKQPADEGQRERARVF
jgi:hypothetical protein